MRRLILFFTLLPTLPAHAQDDPPTITGYVTRVTTPTDFDINGVRVVLHKNSVLRRDHLGQVQSIEVLAPFLSQRAEVWGEEDHKSITLRTTKLVLYDPQPTKVSGTGIIDLVPGTPNLFRADGRTLDLSGVTARHTAPIPAGVSPTAGPGDLHTNVWIDYRGIRRPDGAVAIEKATYTPNEIEQTETAHLKKEDYDPAAVPADAHQNGLQTEFIGVDFKKIPPYKDPIPQARIDRIGQSLVPAFQKALPAADPTHIHFRFQLIDAENWHDAYALSNGIILVPFQLVQRLPDDSELAALLADSIATVLEKQAWRARPVNEELLAAGVVGAAVAMTSPLGAVFGLATVATTAGIGEHKLTLAEQQSGRVALCLMHDAGYDIAKAPEAWWTLASKSKKNPHRNPPPPRAMNQFGELGTTWHPTKTDPALVPRTIP